MNRSMHPLSNVLNYRNVLLAASIAGATGWIGHGSVVSAQQINPFAVSASSAAQTSASQALRPVARARLQLPEVGDEHAQALASDLAADRQSATSAAHPNRVGPDWSSFTPAAFADWQASPVATSPANSLAKRPSRLPATGESSFSAHREFTPGGGYSAAAALPESPATSPPASTRLVSAAQKRSEFLAQTPAAPTTATPFYLASQTAQSQIDEAAKLFQQASLEYDCAAYASAETSAWAAIEKAAQAIDLVAASGNRAAADTAQRGAVERLQLGRRAIIEAQDFVGPFAQADRHAIARLARAHQTTVVRESLPPMTASYSAEARLRLGQTAQSAREIDGLPSRSEAIDRYLDCARTNLATLAAESLLAAQTMDLLAAIRLGRGEATQLPGPTAICLRRAAVQGQSSNPDLVAKLGHQLADIGLYDEARWALHHSLNLQYHPEHAARLASLPLAGQHAPASQYGSSVLAATRSHDHSNPLPSRVPEVTNISPQQFAAISHSVIPGSPQAQPTRQNPHSNAVDVPVHEASATTPSPAAPSSQSFFKTVTASFRTPTSDPPIDPPIDSQPEERVSSRLLPGIKKWW